MSSSPAKVPEELARFPREAQEAYVRFVEGKSEDDLRILVRAALVDFTPKHKSAAGVTPEGSKKLIEDLGLDSLAIAELVFFFEDLFQVSIPSSEILGLQTVQDLEIYVGRKLREKESSS